MKLVQTDEWEISDIENQISYLLDFILEDGVSRSVLSAKRWFAAECAHIARGEYAHHTFAAMRQMIEAPPQFRVRNRVRIKDESTRYAGKTGEIVGINPITDERIVQIDGDERHRDKFAVSELETI